MYSFVTSLIKRVLKLIIELVARSRGRRFYCATLSGTAYNISVNCDMTISCTCRDFDGSGYLGDLSRQSFSEIFHGPIASRLRSQLATGKLPILPCAICQDLHLTEKENALSHKEHYRLPDKGLMIENTIDCNQACVACNRTAFSKIRKKKNLSLEDIKKISSIIKENKIKHIDFFKFGEPFLSSNICEELKIIRRENRDVEIYTSTNGTVLDNDEKREAALMLDRIIFSIDGINNDILRKYQRKGNFDKAYNNMKQMVSYRNAKGKTKPVLEWKYVLFNWNDKKNNICEAIKLAKQAGIDVISFWPTKSPFYGISWRYYITRFYDEIGTKFKQHRWNIMTYKGVEVKFTHN